MKICKFPEDKKKKQNFLQFIQHQQLRLCINISQALHKKQTQKLDVWLKTGTQISAYLYALSSAAWTLLFRSSRSSTSAWSLARSFSCRSTTLLSCLMLSRCCFSRSSLPSSTYWSVNKKHETNPSRWGTQGHSRTVTTVAINSGWGYTKWLNWSNSCQKRWFCSPIFLRGGGSSSLQLHILPHTWSAASKVLIQSLTEQKHCPNSASSGFPTKM